MKKPLLEKQVCDALLRELTNYEAQATCLSLPCKLFMFYRHDEKLGALEKCGFAPILAQLAQFCSPLLESLRRDKGVTLRARHAFCVRNTPPSKQTTDVANFKVHRDQAAVTINVCIERSVDCVGSGVSLFAPRASSLEEAPFTVLAVYEHRLGHALVVHTGDVWHQTVPIVRGNRSSLIIWCDKVMNH